MRNSPFATCVHSIESMSYSLLFKNSICPFLQTLIIKTEKEMVKRQLLYTDMILKWFGLFTVK